MSKVPVQIKYLNEDYRGRIQYATAGSAAFDLRANIKEPLTIEPGDCVLVGSGLAVLIDDPLYAGLILPRSGLGHKQGVVLGNGTGLIDSDYQGELKVSVFNRSKEAFTIQPDDRIAQYVIVPVLQAELIEVHVDDEFKVTGDGGRGDGGFGSTGQQ